MFDGLGDRLISWANIDNLQPFSVQVSNSPSDLAVFQEMKQLY